MNSGLAGRTLQLRGYRLRVRRFDVARLRPQKPPPTTEESTQMSRFLPGGGTHIAIKSEGSAKAGMATGDLRALRHSASRHSVVRIGMATGDLRALRHCHTLAGLRRSEGSPPSGKATDGLRALRHRELYMRALCWGKRARHASQGQLFPAKKFSGKSLRGGREPKTPRAGRCAK